MAGSFETRLAQARHEGDPAADAVIADFARLPGGEGWRLLDAALDVTQVPDPSVTTLEERVARLERQVAELQARYAASDRA